MPRVMWYEDDRLMPDGILEYLPSKQIRHVIQIGSLGRSNHNVRYSCAASNSRVFPPAIAAVTVLMRRTYSAISHFLSFRLLLLLVIIIMLHHRVRKQGLYYFWYSQTVIRSTLDNVT